MDRYTTLAARQMFEEGRRARVVRPAGASAGGVLPQLHPARRVPGRHGRPDRLGDECPLCRAEVCETLGAVFALHIDTARTWRGGQQQVLLTVLGLRARGHRAVLVAHREGELLSARLRGPGPGAARAGQRSRSRHRVEAVEDHPPVEAGRSCTRTIRMPCRWPRWRCRSARPSRGRRSIASRRVDFHLQSHAFSQWKYRQVDGFIAASNAIKAILVHDGIPAGRIEVVHDGIDVEQDRIACRRSTSHAEYLAAARRAGDRQRRRAGRRTRGRSI